MLGATLDQDRRAGQRHQGFEDAVLTANHHPPIAHLIPKRASIESGSAAIATLLQERPELDGVFFSNDALMLGAAFECQRRGVAIPGQVAMIGFGDLDFSASSMPSLSTIRPPRGEIGRAVADHLSRRFADPQAAAERIDLGFEVVARESS